MKETISISGVSGVGKDFVMDHLEQQGDMQFERINLGSLILQELKTNPWRSREDNIDQAFINAEKQAIKNLGMTMLSMYNTYGNNPNSQHSNQMRIQKLPLNKSLVIESDPDLIVSRRTKDSYFRNRAQNNQQEIAQIQQASTNIAKEIADQKNIPFKIFHNNDDINIENIKDFLEDKNEKLY